MPGTVEVQGPQTGSAWTRLPKLAALKNALAALAVLLVASPLAGQEVSGLAAAAAIESAMVDAIARAEQSVVAIARIKREDAADPLAGREPAGVGRMTIAASVPQPGDPDFVPNEFGTGVIVDRKGLILTNYHVVDENSEHYVTTINRKSYRAPFAADPRSDLAILEIDASDLTPITMGDAGTLRKGQIVIALGNPYSIARDGEASASWGIVANLARKVAPTPDETSIAGRKEKLYHFGTLIQTDAKLNLGTSGGALLNLKGEMIGLTTSLAATAGFEQAAGYAIPVDETFRRVLDTLKEGREVEYGFLGVSPKNLEAFEVERGTTGVRVDAVVRGTPAERFDIRPYDLITRINGSPINDADTLMLNVGRLPSDSVVTLTVIRDGQQRPVNVSLSKFPVRGKKIVTVKPENWRGLVVDHATAAPEYQKEATRLDFSPSGCVTISDVEPGSPGAAAGLTPWMFITHVEGTQVKTPQEFRTAVAGKTGPVKLRLAVVADEQPIRTIEPAVK